MNAIHSFILIVKEHMLIVLMFKHSCALLTFMKELKWNSVHNMHSMLLKGILLLLFQSIQYTHLLKGLYHCYSIHAHSSNNERIKGT